jgi:CHASE2 domain-containing sensor protein
VVDISANPMPAKKQGISSLSHWIEKFIEAAVLSVPLAYIAQATNSLQTRFFDEPWEVVWIALPLGAVAWLSWILLRRSRALALNWRVVGFLAIYCSIFAVASASDLLVWRRMPQGYEGQSGLGRGWILPVTAGDWRYSLAPRSASRPNSPIVVLLDHPHGASREWLRWQDRRMIELARTGGARGVAFDVAFVGNAQIDSLFCKSVDDAGFPVLSAYEFQKDTVLGLYATVPATQQLPCLPLVNQGHAMGLAEADERVRTIPLFWAGVKGSQAALSVRIAQCIYSRCAANDLPVPDERLLRYLPPAAGTLTVIKPDQLAVLERNPSVLRDRFLLVGEGSGADVFNTPFGRLPGTVVHAYAVYSLLASHYVTRPPAWLSAFVVFGSCYVLTLLATQRLSTRRLVAIAVGITTAVIAVSAAAMYFSAVWLDAIYAVGATWLLVPLLLGVRNRLR